MLPAASRRRTPPSVQHSSGVARGVPAHSILDSYRASQQQTAERDEVDGADDAPCSTECVLQIYSAAEFDEQLAKVPDNVLLVIDFYRCGPAERCSGCPVLLF